MRSPFTGVVFALELTHDVNMLLPLLVAVTIAHGFTVLVLRRSILTEKVARRGFHLSREYAVDPLEILFVREVMRTNIVALAGGRADRDAAPGAARRPRRDGRSASIRSSAAIARWSASSRAATCRRIVDGGARRASAPFVAEHSRATPIGRLSRRIAARGRLPDGRDRADALSGRRARHERTAGRDDRADRSAERARVNLDAEERRERVFALPRPFASSRVS